MSGSYRLSAPLNGGEHVYSGPWQMEAPEAIRTQPRAVSCELTLALDETIEMLSLIDQPSYYAEEAGQ